MCKRITIKLTPADIAELVRRALENRNPDASDRIDMVEDIADWLVARYGGCVIGFGPIDGSPQNRIVEIEMDSCSRYPSGVGDVTTQDGKSENQEEI